MADKKPKTFHNKNIVKEALVNNYNKHERDPF